MISKEENNYYARQIILDELGLEGQEKLKNAKVLVVGAGGLGCPLLQYIAAAGVGNIGIVDDDAVNISNLHRQVLFSVDSLGKNKAESAKDSLSKLNPYINIHSYPIRLSVENVFSLFKEYDLIVDCTDNYATRFLINDACYYLSKPFVSASVYRFEGQLSVFNYKGGPTLRCLYPSISSEEFELNCSLSGVLGVLPGVMGLLQANEVIKIILDLDEIMSGKIMIYNAKRNSFDQFKINRDTSIDYDYFFQDGKLNANNYTASTCATDASVERITAQQLWSKEDLSTYSILDVRNYEEQPFFGAEGVLQIPLDKLLENSVDLPMEPNVIVVCKSGVRSLKAIEALQQRDGNHHFINLDGGINKQFIEKWIEKRRS